VNYTISNSQNITLDPVKVDKIAQNLSIQNKTLAKEIVVEKAKEDQMMKEAIANKTHDKQKKEANEIANE
jgi:hypothetical protein